MIDCFWPMIHYNSCHPKPEESLRCWSDVGYDLDFVVSPVDKRLVLCLWPQSVYVVVCFSGEMHYLFAYCASILLAS